MTAADFVNLVLLYRDGKGLFPLPLAGPQELPEKHLDTTPDVQSEDHPVFYGIPDRVAYLSKILVTQVFCRCRRIGTPSPTAPARDHAAPQRCAAVRGKGFRPRAGHGAAHLACPSDLWNNWCVGREAGPFLFRLS